jgi:hypothetical protein
LYYFIMVSKIKSQKKLKRTIVWKDMLWIKWSDLYTYFPMAMIDSLEKCLSGVLKQICS